MNRSMISVVFVVGLVAGVASAPAHPGHFGSAFHAHSLAEAKILAGSEFKQIFLHVSAPDGRGCPHLLWPTPEGRGMIDLLARETVIVELDARRHASELAALKIKYVPVTLLLDSSGVELRRWEEDALFEVMDRDLQIELSNGAAVDRANKALEKLGPDHFFTRERLAGALTRDGQYVEALAQYAWCLDRIMERTDAAAIGRRPYVFVGLADLANLYPAAWVELNARRGNIEAEILSEDDAKLANDWARCFRTLGSPSAVMDLFDRLGKESRARHGLFDFVFDRLVESKRYDEIDPLVQAQEAFAGEVDLYRRSQVLRPASAEQGDGRGSRRFAVGRGVALVEVLAGLGRNAEAEELILSILDFDGSPMVKENLFRGLARSGNDRLAREWMALSE